MLLPIVEKPPIIAYLHHAYYLGILFTNNSYRNYFSSIFINLYYNRSISNRINFVLEKWYAEEEYFNYNKIGYNHSLDMVTKSELVEIFIRMIDLGYYSLFDLDEFFIPNRVAYNKFNFIHECMIYGYCISKKEFNIIGYTDKNIYEKSKLSFNDFAKALYFDSTNWVNFVKIGENYVFGFDIEQTKNHIYDYLHSKNTYNQYADDFCSFGINAVIEYANDLIDDYGLFDLRYIRILLEHKICMHLRIKYLYEKGFLSSERFYKSYSNIVQKYQIIFSLSIIATIRPKSDSLLKIREHIIDSINTEKQILEDVLISLV